MRSVSLKCVGLVVLLVPLTGVVVSENCGCYSGYEFVLDEDSVSPPSGPIVADMIDITISGTEAYWGTDSCYMMSGSISKWDPNVGWRYVPVGSTTQYGAWGPDPNHGVLAKKRTYEITFLNVPLDDGENKFSVGIDIDGCDGCDDEWASVEVIYTH